MDYSHFINGVQERTDSDDRELAVRLTRAAIGTLGERLYRTERHQLLAPLPNQIRRFANDFEHPEPSRKVDPHYNLEEYFNRVSARADVRYPQAVRGALAVMDVLKQALGEPAIRDILAQLPQEYHELFGAEPTKPDSPTHLQGH